MPSRKLTQTAIIFTFAPAGLGHLRVTNALYKGLPGNYPSHLLGTQDESITAIHRVMSIHPIARNIMEKGQNGLIEDAFTYAYRKYLWSHTDVLYKQLLTLIDEHVEIPKKLLVIASHFGLAHQLSALKNRLFKDRKIKLLLIVQVTDDSPQQIWYVPGADLTCIPSESTRSVLGRYGRLAGLAPTDFAVLPYPVSPQLSQNLTANQVLNRQEQLNSPGSQKIHVSIPVSGAAVGTNYLSGLINFLTVKSDRFVFHLISKAVPFTKDFLSQMLSVPSVKLYVSDSDREVVNLYDKVYSDNIISLEVTKPSEQAFKALLTPKMHGGSLLLFSAPVGRQEYDNLYFLRRHSLMPKENEQINLFKYIANPNLPVNRAEMQKKVKHWRALRLPDDPQMAGDFIYRLHKNKILSSMAKWVPPHNYSGHKHELGSDGVAKFWATVFAKFDL